jgi:ACT domain-containing protein
MSGGVVQLVATGAQDAWLTGKPEISFFRSNYKRYTHYAHSVERQIIQGQPTAGGISTIRFEKKGDLMNYTYLTARDTNGAAISNLDWSKVIDKVELLIGGQVIDTQDFEYMTDIEPVTGAQTFSNRYLNNNATGSTNQKNVFFPFKFFFCKDWSVSLPLVALQYHDVELRITWSSNLGSTINFGPTTAPVLSAAPQATMNVIVTPAVQTSNVSNLVVGSQSGPLFPGQLVVAPTSNIQANVAVIQYQSNATTAGISNVQVAFSNTANTSINSLFSAGATLQVYSPVAAGAIAFAVTTAQNATSGFLPLNSINNPLNVATGNVAVGQYVAGTAINGPVVVTSVSNIANSNVAISFPSQPNSATPVTPVGTIVSFFQGTANSATTYSQLQFQCWTNFVYLDQTERDYFAKTTQDLLITQVNRVTVLNTPTQEIALAQPIKFLAFPAVNYNAIYANGANSAVASNYTLKTQVNGVDVGEARFMPQWVDLPQYYNTPFGYNHNQAVANVGIISYCLDTSKLQPTGTLNFSRIDTFRLVTSPLVTNGILGLCNSGINYTSVYLYAVNYNVLRIQNGLGGVLYAN